MNQKIELTKEELEEIKDKIKFRTKVVYQLKQLNGVSGKVTKLEVHSNIHWLLIVLVLSGMVGIAWRVLGK